MLLPLYEQVASSLLCSKLVWHASPCLSSTSVFWNGQIFQWQRKSGPPLFYGRDGYPLRESSMYRWLGDGFRGNLSSRFPQPDQDRYVFCMAPIDVCDRSLKRYFYKFAYDFSTRNQVRFTKKIPQIHFGGPQVQRLTALFLIFKLRLGMLEEMYKICDVYLWLSNRYCSLKFLSVSF